MDESPPGAQPPELPAPEESPGPSPRVPPEPGAVTPIAPEYRLPLRGKMVAPTASPATADRMANIIKIQKARRRRGFLIGLLVGQLLILGVDLGGELLLRLLAHRVTVNPPVHFRALVFIGMTAGIAITAVFIGLMLGFQGVAWFFGRKRTGFFRAVGRGFKRLGKAAISLGLTLAVIGATSWFLIPKSEWKRTANWLEEQKGKGVEWIKNRFPAPGRKS